MKWYLTDGESSEERDCPFRRIYWLPENLITGNDLARLIFLVDKFDERPVVDQVLPSKLRALTKTLFGIENRK